MTKLRLFCLIIAFIPTTYAQLPTDRTAKMDIGISLGYTANACDTKDTLSVAPYAFYDNNRVYIEGGEAGVYAYKDNKHHLRAGVAYDGRSFDPDDANPPLKQLDKRKAHVVAQANYMLITPIGGFRTKVAKSLGDNDGTVISLAHVSRFNHNKTTVYPSFGIAWYDKKYNNYYYGIDHQESGRAGLPAYTAKSGVSPFVSVTAFHDITDKISLLGSHRMEWFSSTQKDSPMTDSNLQSTTRIGVSYKF